MRRLGRPIGPCLLGALIAALAGAGLGIVGSRTLGASNTSPVVSVGKLSDFALGSATQVTINRRYVDVRPSTEDGRSTPEIFSRSSAQVFIVRSATGGIDALVARDTHSGCVLLDNSVGVTRGGGPAILGLSGDAWFFDPCHGASYDRTGTCIEGPCPRDLDRFSLVVDMGKVLVDVGLPLRGAARR